MGWFRSLWARLGSAAVLALLFLGLSGCGSTNSMSPQPEPQPQPQPSPQTGDIKSINHIIFMIMENRSFDHIFGQLVTYRVMQGLPAGGIDGLPPTGTAACNQPGIPPMANGSPSCMPTNLKNASYTDVIAAFKLNSMCIENTSSSWHESHQDFSLFDNTSDTPAMDGYAWSAGGDALFAGTSDADGIRAMGFYDWNTFPYHYFLATQFATSDRWFSPCPCET